MSLLEMPLKTSLLVSILVAASTTAYFTGRIYQVLAETKAQAVAMQQRQREFFSTPVPKPVPNMKFDPYGSKAK